jgi:hypothetical protein
MPLVASRPHSVSQKGLRRSAAAELLPSTPGCTLPQCLSPCSRLAMQVIVERADKTNIPDIDKKK